MANIDYFISNENISLLEIRGFEIQEFSNEINTDYILVDGGVKRGPGGKGLIGPLSVSHGDGLIPADSQDASK